MLPSLNIHPWNTCMFQVIREDTPRLPFTPEINNMQLFMFYWRPKIWSPRPESRLVQSSTLVLDVILSVCPPPACVHEPAELTTGIGSSNTLILHNKYTFLHKGFLWAFLKLKRKKRNAQAYLHVILNYSSTDLYSSHLSSEQNFCSLLFLRILWYN